MQQLFTNSVFQDSLKRIYYFIFILFVLNISFVNDSFGQRNKPTKRTKKNKKTLKKRKRNEKKKIPYWFKHVKPQDLTPGGKTGPVEDNTLDEQNNIKNKSKKEKKDNVIDIDNRNTKKTVTKELNQKGKEGSLEVDNPNTKKNLIKEHKSKGNNGPTDIDKPNNKEISQKELKKKGGIAVDRNKSKDISNKNYKSNLKPGESDFPNTKKKVRKEMKKDDGVEFDETNYKEISKSNYQTKGKGPVEHNSKNKSEALKKEMGSDKGVKIEIPDSKEISKKNYQNKGKKGPVEYDLPKYKDTAKENIKKGNNQPVLLETQKGKKELLKAFEDEGKLNVLRLNKNAKKSTKELAKSPILYPLRGHKERKQSAKDLKNAFIGIDVKRKKPNREIDEFDGDFVPIRKKYTGYTEDINSFKTNYSVQTNAKLIRKRVNDSKKFQGNLKKEIPFPIANRNSKHHKNKKIAKYEGDIDKGAFTPNQVDYPSDFGNIKKKKEITLPLLGIINPNEQTKKEREIAREKGDLKVKKEIELPLLGIINPNDQTKKGRQIARDKGNLKITKEYNIPLLGVINANQQTKNERKIRRFKGEIKLKKDIPLALIGAVNEILPARLKKQQLSFKRDMIKNKAKQQNREFHKFIEGKSDRAGQELGIKIGKFYFKIKKAKKVKHTDPKYLKKKPGKLKYDTRESEIWND